MFIPFVFFLPHKPKRSGTHSKEELFLVLMITLVLAIFVGWQLHSLSKEAQELERVNDLMEFETQHIQTTW